MKSTIRSVVLFIICGVISICARERRENHTMPLREIDRPLTLPQRQSQISGGYTVGFSWNNDSKVHNEMIPFVPGYNTETYRAERPMFFLPDFKYGFNDSLQLSIQLGMPSLHYQFLNNTTVSDGEVSIRNTSLAVFVGLGGISYTSLDDDFNFTVKGGLEGKFPQKEWFWIDGTLSVLAGSMSYIDITVFPAFGFQLTDKLALIPGAGAVAHLDFTNGNSTIPFASAVVDCNFTNHFSTDFFFEVKDESRATEFSGGFTLNFNW